MHLISDLELIHIWSHIRQLLGNIVGFRFELNEMHISVCPFNRPDSG